MAGEKVLVIDDKPDSLQFLTEYILRPNGYSFITAGDGEEGFQKALEEKPDLIIMDLRMPRMTGLEILSALHERNSNIPVILMTLHGSEETAVQAFRLGAKDYLIKPYEIEEMLEAIEKALTETRLRQEKSQLSQGIVRANAKLERRVKELNILYGIGKSVTSLLDLEKVLNRIVEAGVYITGAEEGSLFLVDEESNELYLRAARGLGEQYAHGLRLRVENSIAGQVVKTGEPILIATSDEKKLKVKTGYLVKSLLTVPLKVQDKVIGVLSVDNLLVDKAFTENDEYLLSALADYAAIAIDNARLYEEERRQTEELAGLHQISQAMSALTDIRQVYEHLTERIGILTGVEMCGVLLYDEEENALVSRLPFYGVPEEVIHSYRIPIPKDSEFWRIWQEEEYFICNDVLNDPLVAEVGLSDLALLTGVQATLFALMTVSNRRIGVVQASNKLDGSPFNEEDAHLLCIFANQAAAIVENARLFKETERRFTESMALLELGKEMTTLLPLEELLQVIVQSLMKIFPHANKVFLHLLDESSGKLRPMASSKKRFVDSRAGAMAVGEGIAGQALQRNETIYVPDVSNDRRFVTLDPSASFKSLLVAPLTIGGKGIGALTIDSRELRAFTPDDERIVTTFANQAAIAIQNAQLYTLEQTRRQVADTLLEMGKVVSSSLELDEVLEAILDQLKRVVDVEAGSILLVDELSGPGARELAFRVTLSDELRKESVERMPFGKGIVGLVAETGEPLTVLDAQNDPRWYKKIDEITGFVTKSLLCVPLKARNEVIGVIELVNKLEGKFTEEDKGLLSAVAASVAIAIENARLFRAESQRGQEMELLLDIGQTIVKSVTEKPLEVLKGIVEGACMVVGADCSVVYPYDPDREGFFDVDNVAAFGTWHDLELSSNPRASSEDIAAYVKREGLLIRSNIEEEEPEMLNSPFIEREEIKACARLLLEAGEKPLGILSVNFRTSHWFTDDEIRVLRIFADQAAIAIQHARLFERVSQDLAQTNYELQRTVGELEELREIDRIISSTLELETVLNKILEGALRIITKATFGSIRVIDETTRKVISEASRGRKKETMLLGRTRLTETEERITSWVIREGKSVLIPDIAKIPGGTFYEGLDPDMRAKLTVPILAGEGRNPMGVINLESTEPDAFNENDQRLLEALASQAVLAIQNAQRFEQLVAEREAKIRAERIAAMGDIASNMVHRINNTVGAIRVLVQQIRLSQEEGKLSDQFLKNRLNKILESADRTLETAQRIRTPFQSIKKEKIDVKQTLETALENLDVPAKVRFEVDFAPDLPPVKATQQLSEVFYNLIKNALEAMEDMTGESILRVTGWMEGQWIEIAVIDSGPGIPDEIRDVLFELGVTSKPGQKGLGFGLWWSKTFVQKLEGTIKLDQGIGSGCKFKVRLPPWQEPLSPTAGKPGGERQGITEKGVQS